MFPTDLSPNFSTQNARSLCAASALAYASEPELIDAMAKKYVPASNVFFIRNEKTDTQCFVATNAGCTVFQSPVIVVAFCGTKDFHNALTDCDVLPISVSQLPERNDPPIKFHRGFYGAFESIRVEVFQQIKAFREKFGANTPIYFTGHSLGGALAMIAQYDWLLSYEEKTNLYTFGQPRVGNREFARIYNSALKACSYRVRDKEDGVPLVPWLCGFYHHAATEIFYDELGVMHTDYPDLLRVPSFLLGLYFEFKIHHTIAVVADHPVSRYEKLFSESAACIAKSIIEAATTADSTGTSGSHKGDS